MEIWRVGYDTAPRPKVVSTHNLAVALVCHLAAFVLFWLYSACHGLFDSHDEPKIEFFDPTVVVVENLDGNPDEPPPLKKVEPEPPPPPPPPRCCRHNRHECHECHHNVGGATLLGAIVGGIIGAIAS